MIVPMALSALLCAFLAWYNRDDRTARIAFIAFSALNLLGAGVALYEGNALKFLPPDEQSTPYYRR